jgi:hypothetical protein
MVETSLVMFGLVLLSFSMLDAHWSCERCEEGQREVWQGGMFSFSFEFLSLLINF